MKTLGIALVALAVSAAPATAQVTGMVNRDAPKIEQSIDLGSNGVITLNYTAITFAAGNWSAALADESKRDRMRTHINGKADSDPIAFFESTSDVTINGVRVAAGEYDVAFRLNDDYKWELRFKAGENATTIALDLMPSEMASKRLIFSLHAGDESSSAGVYIAFGEQIGTLDIKPAPAEEAAGSR